MNGVRSQRWAALAVVVSAVACRGKGDKGGELDAGNQGEPPAAAPSMGKPLFSCGVADFAWGSVAYGHVLDDRGRIWFYDLGRTWTPSPAGEGLYTLASLRERFANPVLTSRQVEPEQLRKMLQKVARAREGTISRRQEMNDAGGAGCEAYVWERPDAYARVELGSVGDVHVINSSQESRELAEWLGKLGLGRRAAP